MTGSTVPRIDHAAFVAGSASGGLDAMGLPFSDWLLARHDDQGRALRDVEGRVMYETQAAWLERHGSPIVAPTAQAQLGLFA